MSEMLNWAKREVEFACKKEAPDRKEGEWDYGCACYESSLKAYECLLEDGHSGMSWAFTRDILMRLMRNQPLTPIEDLPEVWNEVSEKPGMKTYQCNRMSSLFKDVYKDGTVSYHDIDRVYGVYVNNPDLSWYSKLVSDVVDEYDPITMPYVPPIKPYEVVCDEFLSDKRNGDFDHKGIVYMITPEGERIDINRYYDLTGKEKVLISKEEFYKRKENV